MEGIPLKKVINANINRSHIMDMFENHVLGIVFMDLMELFQRICIYNSQQIELPAHNLICGCVSQV